MTLDIDQEVAGRYRMLRMLGRGGFGETWEGLDLKTQERVAIKALDLSRVGDWKSVELFEREAHVLESLNHPRIPDYLDFIPVESDRTGFLIQELAPGADLERIVSVGRRSTEDEARELAFKMLEILEYLYSRKPPVVHRDIKPSNILMDENSEIHLVDFGSVQDIRRRTTGGGSTVAGTFGYMAPEQLQGVATPASDLYGLGMTLLYVMSGRDPAQLPQKRLKANFREVLKVSDHFGKFLDRMIEPVAEDRFASPTEARDFLLGTSVASISKMVAEMPSSTDFAAMMRAREEQRVREEQAALVQADQNAQLMMKKLKRRVSVVEDSEGWVVQLGPKPFGSRVGATLPAAAFIFVNPGFAIAGGFPFLGAVWPIFSDWWPGRWIIWFCIVVFGSIFVARKLGTKHVLRVTRDGYFGLQRVGKKEPLEFGRLEDLEVYADVDNGFGRISLPKGVLLEALNPLDVQEFNRTLGDAGRTVWTA